MKAAVRPVCAYKEWEDKEDWTSTREEQSSSHLETEWILRGAVPWNPILTAERGTAHLQRYVNGPCIKIRAQQLPEVRHRRSTES